MRAPYKTMRESIRKTWESTLKLSDRQCEYCAIVAPCLVYGFINIDLLLTDSNHYFIKLILPSNIQKYLADLKTIIITMRYQACAIASILRKITIKNHDCGFRRQRVEITIPGIKHIVDEVVNEGDLGFGNATGIPVKYRHDHREALSLLLIRLCRQWREGEKETEWERQTDGQTSLSKLCESVQGCI